MSGSTRELLRNSRDRSGERTVGTSSYSHCRCHRTSSIGWQWRALAAPGSCPGLITPTSAQQQQDDGSFCSADRGESRWTPGSSATSTGEPLSLSCPRQDKGCNWAPIHGSSHKHFNDHICTSEHLQFCEHLWISIDIYILLLLLLFCLSRVDYH